MKIIIISFICSLGISIPFAHGQLTIENCQQKAKENYPLVKRYELIEKSQTYNLSNAAKGYLPSISLSAKATYQSEVTTIPIKLPNIQIDGLSKDQYQTIVEVNQTIWDGGEIYNQQRLTRASSNVEQKQLEVDLYTLNERINNLFFGILLLDEQLNQNKLLQEELQRNYDAVSAYVTYGIANQADLDAVKVNQLNAIQKATELQSTRLAYQQMLSIMIGEEINDRFLQKPLITNPDKQIINRPELSLFDAQYNQIEIQKKMINVRNLPKIGLFVQGGYGKPGLNMLKNDFEPFYIAGLRLSWNFGGLYTHKNDRLLLENNQNNLNTQRETFLFNTELEITQQNNEIDKLHKLMQDDDEIIQLRENIRKASEAKVKNGTLSVTDLLSDITSEDQARQNKLLHEIQLLITIYQLKNITNN